MVSLKARTKLKAQSSKLGQNKLPKFLYVWPIKTYFLQLVENFLRQCLKTNQFKAESKTAPEETAVEAELKIMFPVFPCMKNKEKKC